MYEKKISLKDAAINLLGVKIPIEKIFIIDVKAGYKAGTKIFYSASDDFSRDVVFSLNELPHEHFDRFGNVFILLSREEAMSRETISISMLDGREHILSIRGEEYKHRACRIF